MSFKNKTAVTLGIIFILIFPLSAQPQGPSISLHPHVTPDNYPLDLQGQLPFQGQPHQYEVLKQVAFYRVKVRPEVIAYTPKLKINFIILGGRINGPIISGNFVTDKNIMVDGEETINGDISEITAEGIGSSKLNSQIIADDGTIISLRYTGFYLLAKDWKKYPVVSLLVVMIFSTDNPNYKNVVNTKYMGKGELNLLTMEVTYNIFPVR